MPLGRISVAGYDRASGQIYTEQTVPLYVYASSGNGPSWVHESPWMPVCRVENSRTGANTLKHMAMKQTLLDQRRLSPDHFTHVPWSLAAYLWDCLGRR